MSIKKILNIFMLGISIFFCTAIVDPSHSWGICGDVDGDGRFEITDALNIGRMSATLSTPQIQTSDMATVIDICADSDLNRNGDVDVLDALVTARTSAGLVQPPSLLNCPAPSEIWDGDEDLPQKCAQAIWSGPPSCFVEPARAICYDLDVDIYLLSSTPELFDVVFEYRLGSRWWEAIPMPSSQNPMFLTNSPQHVVFSWDLFADLWLRHGYSAVPLAGWGVRVSMKDPYTGVTVNSCDNVYDLNVPPPPRGSFPCSVP